MILTARPKKEKKVSEPVKLTLDNLESLKPIREPLHGRDKVLDEGCDCELSLDDDFIEGTPEANRFFEYESNHSVLCLYRILCKG